MPTTKPLLRLGSLGRLRPAVALVSVGCAAYGIGLAVAGEPRGAAGWVLAGFTLYVNQHLLTSLYRTLHAMADQAQADGQIIEALTNELLEQ